MVKPALDKRGASGIPDSRNRSQTRRAIPPVAHGTESMRAGLEDDTNLYPCTTPLHYTFCSHLFADCSLHPGNLARISKLLAHDNKSNVICLLNPATASRVASFWPHIVWRGHPYASSIAVASRRAQLYQSCS